MRSGALDGKIDWSKAEFTFEKPLEKHWDKHDQDSPELTMDGYLQEARQLLRAPLREGVLEELVRGDGGVARYQFSMNDFVAGNPGRTIKTFFRPEKGAAYWTYEHERNQ